MAASIPQLTHPAFCCALPYPSFSYDRATGEHSMKYDDGEKKDHALWDMHWKLEATEHAFCRGKYVPPPATPPPTLTAPPARAEAPAPTQLTQPGSAAKVVVAVADDAAAPEALVSPVVNAISSNKRQIEGSNPSSPKRIRVETKVIDVDAVKLKPKPAGDGHAKTTADTGSKQVSISNFFNKMSH